ncbi:MAG TPA: GNAT family N-acetyltransferase [Acetobacteraceae bacterium]|nr:GNAT family N-acetyltransferase [Acetobacteraceae bacterium]
MPDLCHGPFHLRPPETPAEWETYHRIRREVLLEAQKYAMEHPDEHAPGHHPMLLWRDLKPVGSIRIDIDDAGRAGLRLVAVDPDLQKQGCGRALLSLAEAFARERGCTHAVLYATLDAVGFYAKAGYQEEDWDDVYVSGIVQMAKALCDATQEEVR